MTNWKIEPVYREMSSMKFVQEVASLFDLRRLREFKVRTSDSMGVGIHGNCKPPGYPKLTARNRDFRISCSIASTAFHREWPRPLHMLAHGTHAGTVRVEAVAESVNELVAFVAGHELFHFLGQATFREGTYQMHEAMAGYPLTDGTNQIPGRIASERRADQMGYEFLYAVREDRDPVEVAAAILDDEGLIAPQRYPYTKG